MYWDYADTTLTNLADILQNELEANGQVDNESDPNNVVLKMLKEHFDVDPLPLSKRKKNMEAEGAEAAVQSVEESMEVDPPQPAAGHGEFDSDENEYGTPVQNTADLTDSDEDEEYEPTGFTPELG